jgi:Ni,Fe-hydrogenase III small subunit/NAD-dependent dihydropyrimidine dehydrogenase PreA subunit
MIRTLINRFEQGYKTIGYPKKPVTLPREYRGRLEINRSCTREIVDLCVDNCPQEAIDGERRVIDLGRCIFCGACEQISEKQFVRFTNHFELAVGRRESLITDGSYPDLAAQSVKRFKSLFGKSLQLRQVSAGGCNACEADINVLNTPAFDLARFGIQFVASPRHADGIMVTGPVTVNMKTALLKTYEAIPQPKVVIATGSCALSGGPFYGSEQVVDWIDKLLPVNLFIPGCPPHPLTILHALLNYFK